MSSRPGILQGHEMDDEEISAFLTGQGVGVLSMSNEGTPYGIPLSFGYDGGDRLYFLFAGHSEAGKTVTDAERSEEASFAVYDTFPENAWRSVVVEGAIDRITIDDWETAREAMGDNAYRPDLLTNVDLQEDPRVWALGVAEWSGRKSESE
jgi:nitroimidazol reductase NimA-like FMN-containing flavoprotein (pyridoxamine 5'-phosphate oxidase superfamily)